MSLRVRERLGVADAVTLANAGIGFVAAVAAIADPTLAARLVLLAAITDALDGIVARRFGSTEVGPLLDSITDVVSFGATPALFLYAAVSVSWAGPLDAPPLALAGGLVVPSLFVAFSILRTGFYTVYVGEDEHRPGIQNTLASTILVTAYLSGLTTPAALLALSVVVSVAMVAPFPLPKLRARDASVMGVVQAGAILAPTVLSRVFPRVLLVAAVAYAALGPRYYWGE
ncbi:protein sorting system archaetidylserine synthase [Haloarculaceae archaeon H-GB2-1]|nr:protein sorting system archaetidylserine synthase [Haloarculaceae archaeon H-GB1-1]MEA5387410.1 protein sorting system archaetidylserine synthase [Haloarculaceae archaeon H-GB11]MEA5408882.1 protein sorting system archaetidylserine synthase [Haloarculaceae archaeon H-GB2-1]